MVRGWVRVRSYFAPPSVRIDRSVVEILPANNVGELKTIRVVLSELVELRLGGGGGKGEG